MQSHIKFPNTGQKEFFSTVKARVDQYFVSRNKSKHANLFMYFKTGFFLLTLISAYLLLIYDQFNLLGVLALWSIMGFVHAFIGVNICHDAIHGSYSSNKRVNKVLGYIFNLVGANAYMWNITHNVVHHTYTNIDGHDEDLETIPIIRLSPSKPRKKIHYYQHWYAFLFYGLASISWVLIKDYRKFFQKQIGNYDNKHHPLVEYFNLFFFKAVYYFLFIAVPVWLTHNPWWYTLIGFSVMHFFEGYTLAITFMLAHLVEETQFPLPDLTGTMEENWAVHQMITTADFARKNPVVSFFTGGLNFQIEHHLFPKVCHVHYPAISEIVKQTAIECDVPYLENLTLKDALTSHRRFLKRIGQTD